MINDLTPYPSQRDSGLPGIGNIPEHWSQGPGFAYLREKKVKNIGLQEKTVLSLSYGRIVVKPDDKLHGLVPESFETYQIVDYGDIIIRSTDLQNDKTSLRIGMVKNRGIITSAYMCMKTTEALLPEYGYLLLHTLDLTKVLYGLGSGLRQNLDYSDFKRLPLFAPPPDEQAAIVRFLNQVNLRIEKAIRAKQKVIELLNEQKQVIIHQAVTRGLDPNVHLKPSGIPWLGDIPKHWMIRPFKYIARRIQNGATPSTAEQSYYENGIVPWYGPSSIRYEVEVGDAVRYLNLSAFKDGKARLIQGPAILVVVIGATAARMALMRDQGATNQQITSFELHDQYCPDFCVYLLRQAEDWLRSTASTATIPIIDSGVLERLPVAYPHLDEQENIVRNISEKTLPLDNTMSSTEREIELLHEYRTRLITDVVTGKLDVREAAAGLPVEAEELEYSSGIDYCVENEEMDAVAEEEA